VREVVTAIPVLRLIGPSLDIAAFASEEVDLHTLLDPLACKR